MGFFSWIAQDTGESILNEHVCDQGGYMHDDKGNTYGPRYDGYGRFCGMDFYLLLALMNPEVFGEIDEDRLLHDDEYSDTIRSAAIHLSYNERIKIIAANLKWPNVTHNKEWEWRNERPKDCPNQGYFQ